MVQEMNILRCYSCHIFQVHIVKKANKWQCKICNEKQSVQHVYYQGSGQDCRLQVQGLNFKKHIEEQQRLEALEKIEVVEKKHNPVGVIEKPAITRSKWDKYMVPQTEYHNETESNKDKGVDRSLDYKKNTFNRSSIFQDNLTVNKNSLDEKLTDKKETEGSPLFRNNVSQYSAATGSTCDDKDVSILTTRNFQSSNTSYQNSNYRKDREENVSLMEKSYLSCTTRNIGSLNHTTNKNKIDLLDEEDHRQSSSSDNCHDSIRKKQNIVIIRKHVKGIKTSDENVASESQSNFSVLDRDSSGKISKRSKLVDESSLQNISLRDIVELNRSNGGKSQKFEAKENSLIANSGLVLNEISNSHDMKVKETEIVETNIKKRTIFETDYDDLEEILDF